MKIKTLTKAMLAATVLLLMQLSGCSSLAANSPKYQPSDELVVLAHGLGRSDWAMWRFAQKLEDANYKVCRLDYSSIGKSVEAVKEQTTMQINACIVGAPKVHFVGHSLGGLVVRSYLQNNLQSLQANQLGEVVLMGTPNKGSELADHLSESWLMQLGGGVSQALVTGSNSFGNQIKELDVNIGVIAGTQSSGLTSKHFSGENDGLVSVESTKLNSMSDFITIEVGHSQMRYNQEVAEQTVHFLQKGTFEH